MSESNYLANERGTAVKNIILQTIFLIIPLSGLMIFGMYLSNKDEPAAKMLVLVMIIPYILCITAYVIFLIKLMIKRWNRTINKIDIESDNLSIKTFPIFWYKQRNYVVKTSSVVLKNRTFPWYGKEKKDGLVIKINNQEELYLVEDYFDNYEKILSHLYQKI